VTSLHSNFVVIHVKGPDCGLENVERARESDFSLPQRVQTGFGDHTVPCSMSTGVLSPE
jgi:hypothetical protein